jgi:hypothetical protein
MGTLWGKFENQIFKVNVKHRTSLTIQAFWDITLKMKILQSVEASVTIYQSARCNISEDLNLQQHRCEQLTFLIQACYMICYIESNPVITTLHDISSIASDILWYQLTPHC